MTDIIFPTDFATKSNPVDADLLIIADSEDGNEMKKITVGSMTADIWDGLIVDGSASATTTYSSDKINTLNTAQDTVISGLATTKLTRAGQLRTGNGAWKTTYNDASGNETELTLWASTRVFTSNGATSAPSWEVSTADVVSLTEDTTWDMDADFLLAYDNSATANRKQKANVYRASSAEVAARTATNKFTTPAQLPVYANWTTSRAWDSTGTQNIAHWLWIAPKRVRIVGVKSLASSGIANSRSDGTYNGTTTSTAISWVLTTTTSISSNSTTSIVVGQTAANNLLEASITVDATNIVLTWTATGSPSNDSIFISWEANT